MLTIQRLTVEGFRGFRDAEEFEFAQSATELFGDNHSAKSSTLNAIEWALFGQECVGKQTGIRERIGWIIPNQHLLEPSVRVQLDLKGPDGTYVIVRTLGRTSRKATLEDSLELMLPDGTALADDACKQYLAGLLQFSFRDFLTTVYQHQEAIRAVLTQEPKDRNDAFDRLLGLSDQRNLLSALDGADLRGRQKHIGKDFLAFEEQVQAGLAARENDLAALRQEADEAGLSRSQLNGNAALDAASKIAVSVQDFAREANLDLLNLPVPDDWHGLVEFDKSTRKQISRLRGQVPGVEEQKNLLSRQQKLLEVKAALESIRQRWTDINAQTRALDKEHGNRKAVDTKVTEATEKLEAELDHLRQTNGLAAVVREAIQFLDHPGNEEAPCPVCETPALGLADRLKELWTSKLKTMVEGITANIDARKARLNELRGIASQYRQLNDDADSLLEQHVVLRDKAVVLLALELGQDDDALALLVAELQRLDARLQQLGQAVQERQERLDVIEGDLGRVRLIRHYLHHEERKNVLEKIQESEAFKRLESIRDQVAELVEDSEAIKTAVSEVAREEAETKLASAGQIIDEYFRELSRNPAVRQLKLTIVTDKRSRRNSYELTDQAGKDLMPILSQGDLNVLALAIFLGLATTAKESSTFGFLMLDDPSQSLGSEHKKQLAHLLDQVARGKQVIVATMDAEFHERLTESFTRIKREYHFGEWSPDHGPTITMQDPAGVTTVTRSERRSNARLEGARR
jgi:DNA repair exonuclease SbcCD ATPase subunit